MLINLGESHFDKTLELGHYITVEVSFPLVPWRRVIQRVKTHLSDAGIRNQMQAENDTIIISGAERIIGRNNTPTSIQWKWKERASKTFIKSRGVFPVQKFWHTHVNCQGRLLAIRTQDLVPKVNACRPKLTRTTNHIPTDYTNCLGIDGVRWLGYLHFQDHGEAIQIYIKNNLAYKEAWRQYEAAIWLPKTDKAQLQEQIKEILSKVTVQKH